MNRLVKLLLPGFCALASCSGNKQPSKENPPIQPEQTSSQIPQTSSQIPDKKLREFVPQGYILFDSVSGDLNKDAINDYILIIKGTQQDQVVQNEHGERLDRNRRGLVILFGGDSGYHQVLMNKECFSSENEDGGVYFPPELSVEVSKGNLIISYAHGRYGFWSYTFRYQNPDFELIGFDASRDRGPVVEKTTSINFLTGKKQEKENTNENAEGEDEVFKETWSVLHSKKKILLSQVEDLDALSIPE